MPRRGTNVTDTATDTAGQAPAAEQPADTAGQAAPPTDGETQSAAPQPKPEKPLGPMTTRTGAPALVIKAPQGQRVFTAGGDKGAKIAELLQTKPEMPRKEIAAMVGCSQSRVAEVARVLGISKSRAETQAANEAAAAAAPPPETQPTA
jgi:hypothetical protein